MSYLKPDIYQKSIFDINYKKLYKKGISCLIFDLDNTLALIDEAKCPDKVKKLINNLKQDFTVVIISNNVSKRIKPYKEELEIDAVAMAMKPLPVGLSRIREKYHLRKSEMMMIGDQLVTDILSGKIYNISTCLVEPLGKKDLKITGLNRMIENKILDKYEKREIFKRGKFYE